MVSGPDPESVCVAPRKLITFDVLRAATGTIWVKAFAKLIPEIQLPLEAHVASDCRWAS